MGVCVLLCYALSIPERPRSRQKTLFMLCIRITLTRVHHGESLVPLKRFLNLYIELRFCMRQDTISVAPGKYSRRKRPSAFRQKFNCSIKLLHICPGLLATQHAQCHKEYYSPRGQAVSTSHFAHSALDQRI